MFRNCLAQCSRSVTCSPASASSPLRSFHTTRPIAESRRVRNARLAKKANNQLKEKRLEEEIARKPHPVVGYRQGEEHKWTQSDLAQLIITEEQIAETTKQTQSQPTTVRNVGQVHLPKLVGWSVGDSERKLLFEQLPAVSAESGLGPSITQSLGSPDTRAAAQNVLNETARREKAKLEQFAKLLDLRNADKPGIALVNRKRIIEAFSEPENPFDTGRPEVQAALMTYQIHNLWDHLTTFKRDVGNRRGLRMLVHKRAKVLKYLKNKSLVRYETVLKRLGLEPDSVEGELIV